MRRGVAALALAAALLVALAPSTAALSGVTWPAQSSGDRGTDVYALQALLNHHAILSPAPPPGGRGVVVRGRLPAPPALDGVFGPTTVTSVRWFQRSRELADSGIVDSATWERLAVPLKVGSGGPAVLAVQQELRQKRAFTGALDGAYGASTVAAVSAFQAHMGLPATGSMNATTWRHLVWHFELPRFGATLCDNSTGNGPANWGTSAAVAQIETAAATTVSLGYGRIVVNDVSFEHGGEIGGHETHEVGLDADLRPMRKAHDQCSAGTRWTQTAYDRTATRALIEAIRAAAPGHVKVIFFNDPVLIAEGLVTYHSAHDDHLHVRFCEASHPDRRYDC